MAAVSESPTAEKTCGRRVFVLEPWGMSDQWKEARKERAAAFAERTVADARGDGRESRNYDMCASLRFWIGSGDPKASREGR